MQKQKPIEDTTYVLMGTMTVQRVYEPNTGYLCYSVKPFPSGAGITVDISRIDIPGYIGCNRSNAERVQNAIALCVRAHRELSTGMKTTCLDRL